MIKKLLFCLYFLISYSCFAKGFVVVLLEKNIIFFDEYETELMSNPNKKKLSKLQLQIFLVETMVLELKELGMLWTDLNGPSIHGFMHRILYIFQRQKQVYIIEEIRESTAGAF